MSFNEVLKEIAARGANGFTMEAGDYMQDGLIYCGKCHTPRQARIDLGEGIMLEPPCLCKCRTEERDKEKAADKARAQALENERMRRRCIREEKLLEFTFENDKQPASKYSAIFKRYCDKWEQIKADNIGLILWGDKGRGKSFYAGCICNRLISKGIQAYAITEPQIINDMFKAVDKNEYINRLARYPLLLIDDFGAARATEYSREQIYTIVDERYKANLPTIFTTNLTPAQFDAPDSIAEGRIYDRIKAMGQFIEIKGKNWRQDEASQKAAAFIEIMNGGD
ncbi:MAG: ATP-binding protein [Clostridia bacterium]|nr:ATP-binding protein [Clostridia bacterium]